MNEFSLIDRFFKNCSIQRDDVLLGIGDDAACLQIPPGTNLLVSTDTLVSGIHFRPEWSPYAIASRALRVNISDMAAMAATPCWVTLALTLPEMNEQWLESFSQGLKQTLKEFNIDLVGGDTTRGPLSITCTIMGLAPQGKAVSRKGASPGDVIFVSGCLGAAAMAVVFLDKKNSIEPDRSALMEPLLHPKPRVDLIPVLSRFASAAIDISDGLSADLNHICEASSVGACLIEDSIPLAPLLNKYLGKEAVDLALTGGDDYELCFTVPVKKLEQFKAELAQLNLVCYSIGVIEEQQGLRIKSENNLIKALSPKGYAHF